MFRSTSSMFVFHWTQLCFVVSHAMIGLTIKLTIKTFALIVGGCFWQVSTRHGDYADLKAKERCRSKQSRFSCLTYFESLGLLFGLVEFWKPRKCYSPCWKDWSQYLCPEAQILKLVFRENSHWLQREFCLQKSFRNSDALAHKAL